MENVSILVVDDEESIRLSLTILLKKEGYRVDEAASGVEALEKLRSNKYDIIISDIMMPELDGITILKKVKEFDRRIDVIMITAYASLERAIESLRYGASDFIQKPYENQDILNAVNKIIEDRRLEASYAEKKKLPFKFSTAQLGILRKFYEDGVAKLEDSLRKIAGEIEIEVAGFDVEDLDKLAERVGGEGVPMMGAYISIYGDVSGSFLMLFQLEDCISIVEFVVGEKVTEIEFSLPSERGSKTVMELGDILASSYLAGLISSTDFSLKSTPPTFVHFISGNIRSFLEVRTGKGTYYNFISPINVTIQGEKSKTITGFLTSVFGLRGMRLLSDRLKGE
jgi:CheY-like chemotaxis protein/chemotaxis protein CheY-P-specific phosphatase CheC